MGSRASQAALALGVALLAALPYLGSLSNGFCFDDVPIVAENARIRSLGGISSAFTTDWWAGRRPQSLLYRPLTTATFAVDAVVARPALSDPLPRRLPDDAARPFHIQSLLWHAAASASFFLLLRVTFPSAGLAFASAALFAVHPVHTEAVDGIVGRAELMSACFALLALAVARRAEGRAARLGLCGLLLLAALLSKENAIVAPAIPLLWLLLPEDVRPSPAGALRARSTTREAGGIPRPDRRASSASSRSAASGPKRSTAGARSETGASRNGGTASHSGAQGAGRSVLLAAAALGAAAIVYLALRLSVLHALLGGRIAIPGEIDVDNPIASASGSARLLGPARVFAHVVRLLFFPLRLSADYSFDQISTGGSLDGPALLGLLALGGLAAAAFLLRRNLPAASFGILFFLVAWLPTSNILFPIGTILGERLLYLPSAGICLAAASLLIAAGRRLDPRLGSRLGGAAIAALVLLGAARTWARSPDWRSNLVLFEKTAAAAPRSCKALDGYASELLSAHRPAEAAAWAERALQVYPRYPPAHLTLGKASRELAAAEAKPDRRSDLLRSAREHAREAADIAARAPGDGTGPADAWALLGALALDGASRDPAKIEEARASYARSLAYAPAFVPALIGAGAAQALFAQRETNASGRDRLEEEAVAQFEKALALDPGNGEAAQNVSVTLRSLASRASDPARRAELERRADAYETRALASRQDAGDPSALANLHGLRGNRLLAEQRFDEALAEFHEAARLEPRGARAWLGIGSVLTAQAERAPSPERRAALADEAIAAFARALALEPDNPTAHLDLGISYLNLHRDPAKVAEELRAYLRLVPDAPDRARMEQKIREMQAAAAAGGR